MRALLRLAAGAALLQAAALAAGLVTGTVRSSGGAALSGMTIQVWNVDGTLASQTFSNSSGFWSLSLAAGTYRFLAFDPNGVYATDFTVPDSGTLRVVVDWASWYSLRACS